MSGEKISWSDVRMAINATSKVTVDKEEIQLLLESKFDSETRAAAELLVEKKAMATYRVGRLMHEWGTANGIDCVYLPEIYLKSIVKFSYKDLKKLLPRLETQIAQNKLLGLGYRTLFKGSYLDMSIDEARILGMAKGLDKQTIDSILGMVLMHKAARGR